MRSWGLLGTVLAWSGIGSLSLDEAAILHVEEREETLPMMTEMRLGVGTTASISGPFKLNSAEIGTSSLPSFL